MENIENPIIRKSFKEMDDYVKKLEKFALIGMCGHVLSHGYNSKISSLRYQIKDLPDEYDKLKELFEITQGFLYGLMRDSISYSYENLKEEWFLKFFERWPKATIKIDPNVEWYIKKAEFSAILFELMQNAIKYGLSTDNSNIAHDITIEVKQKIIIISNRGEEPKNSKNLFDLGYSEGNSSGIGLYICQRILDDFRCTIYYRRGNHRQENQFIIKQKF